VRLNNEINIGDIDFPTHPVVPALSHLMPFISGGNCSNVQYCFVLTESLRSPP
jgi:hypothetical protein